MTKQQPEASVTFSYDKHKNKIPYLFIVLMLMFGAYYVKDLKKNTCEAAVGNSLLIRDIIDISVSAQAAQAEQNQGEVEEPTDTEGDAAVLRLLYDRIELPPEVCKGTGVDVGERFHRRQPGPAESMFATTTTSVTPTTTFTTQPTSVIRPQVTVVVNNPVAADRVDPPRTTTTTTATTTTTTTEPPLIRLPDITIPMGFFHYYLWR